MSSDPLERLSRREKEVLAPVAVGFTNQMIAGALIPSVSTNTAKSYVRGILAKLGVSNRAAAASLWSANYTAPVQHSVSEGMGPK